MNQARLRERLQVAGDPFLRRYLGTVVSVLGETAQRDVLDIAAGSGWLRHLGFRRYVGLDLLAPHEHWDIRTPLPEHHVGGYDIAACLGALHFSEDPAASLEQFKRALRPGGELVVSTPWLYPPHDREADRWRMSPRLVFRLLHDRFHEVRLYPVGSVATMATHILNRLLAGPFHGIGADLLPAVRAARPAAVWAATSEHDIPLRWFSPAVLVAQARGPR